MTCTERLITGSAPGVNSRDLWFYRGPLVVMAHCLTTLETLKSASLRL